MPSKISGWMKHKDHAHSNKHEDVEEEFKIDHESVGIDSKGATEDIMAVAKFDSMADIVLPKRRITKNPLSKLLENNKNWAKNRLEEDEHFFARLSAIQQPDYLWIGCSDSRVPANQIIAMPPGEVFVHRNIANIVRADDANCQSVIQYAVQNLKVRHIIVCGHLKCGGCKAAFGAELPQPLEGWLSPLRHMCKENKKTMDSFPDEESRWQWVCEENVKQQVETVKNLPVIQNAWANKQPLAIHGWIYSIEDGILRDLVVAHADDYVHVDSHHVKANIDQ